jgi:hypothetical protein
MKTIILFLLLFFILKSPSFGQSKSYDRITPMHLDLQKYADTTFILRISSIGTPAGSNFYILSKSGLLTNLYYYGNLTKGITMPKEIKGRLQYLSILKDTAKTAINAYFSPQYIDHKDAAVFWNEVVNIKPWQIDDNDGGKCENMNKVYDGVALTFFTITKKDIKSILFFNPKILETTCKGNKNRIDILAIETLFKNYFHFQ